MKKSKVKSLNIRLSSECIKRFKSHAKLMQSRKGMYDSSIKIEDFISAYLEKIVSFDLELERIHDSLGALSKLLEDSVDDFIEEDIETEEAAKKEEKKS